MKIRPKKLVLLFFLSASLFLISCGGTWVDMPGATNCTDEKIEKVRNASMGMTMFTGICSRAGKAYTGDLRCSDGRLQVKCK